MAFWEQDRDWDKFFTTEPESEIREWLNIYENHHDETQESLDDIEMTLEDIRDILKNALDLKETLKANIVVLDKMKDSAEWALDRFYNKEQ